MIEELRNTPEESYHKKLGKMIKKVKAETKWCDIFKIVEEAQRRIDKEKTSEDDIHEHRPDIDEIRNPINNDRRL